MPLFSEGLLIITDGKSSISMHPPVPYSGGYGFHHQVDLVGGPFSGSIEASHYENAEAYWRSRYQEVIGLYRNLSGEVHLANAYENLRVSLRGNDRGHVFVRVEANAGNEMDKQLNYNFTVDQTHLVGVYAILEQWLATDG